MPVVQIHVDHPDSSGVPGRAREMLAGLIGWDAVRRLFPRQHDPR